jgi:hypothetical protein
MRSEKPEKRDIAMSQSRMEAMKLIDHLTAINDLVLDPMYSVSV